MTLPTESDWYADPSNSASEKPFDEEHPSGVGRASRSAGGPADPNLPPPRARGFFALAVALAAALVVCLGAGTFATFNAVSQTERANRIAAQLTSVKEDLQLLQADSAGIARTLAASKAATTAAEATSTNCKTAASLYSGGLILVVRAAQSGLNTSGATGLLTQALTAQRLANATGCLG